MLEIRDVSCSRNETLLFQNLSFILQPGQAIQIVGSNGIGKSTLLKALAGLRQFDSGKFIASESILYAGHQNCLHPHLTPLQNLMFLKPLETFAPSVSEALVNVGLGNFINQICQQLSAGQCQRVVLARLLLSQSKLWLLDEPNINLDKSGQDLLVSICTEHLRNNGAIVIATHTSFAFCDRSLDLAEYRGTNDT